MGHAKQDAVGMAEDVVIKVQGALIVGRGTGNPILFQRVIREIKKMFTK